VLFFCLWRTNIQTPQTSCSSFRSDAADSLRQLKERGLTQKELSKKTGIREATISVFARDAGTSINKEILAKIMEALGVKDVREIIEYVSDDK